jgi:hypothetical protein
MNSLFFQSIRNTTSIKLDISDFLRAISEGFIYFILPNLTIVFLTPQRHFFIFQSLTFIQQLSSVR